VAGVWLRSSDLTPRDKIVEISEEYHDREDDAEGDAIYCNLLSFIKESIFCTEIAGYSTCTYTPFYLPPKQMM
jgi:hypothetical protein